MAPPIALAAAGRSLRRLAEQAPSRTMRDRVEQLVLLPGQPRRARSS